MDYNFATYDEQSRLFLDYLFQLHCIALSKSLGGNLNRLVLFLDVRCDFLAHITEPSTDNDIYSGNYSW